MDDYHSPLPPHLSPPIFSVMLVQTNTNTFASVIVKFFFYFADFRLFVL